MYSHSRSLSRKNVEKLLQNVTSFKTKLVPIFFNVQYGICLSHVAARGQKQGAELENTHGQGLSWVYYTPASTRTQELAKEIVAGPYPAITDGSGAVGYEGSRVQFQTGSITDD